MGGIGFSMKPCLKCKVHFVLMQQLLGIYEYAIPVFCIIDLCKLKISKCDAHRITGCGSNTDRARNYCITLQSEGPLLMNVFCGWQKISVIVANTTCPFSERCQRDECLFISPFMIDSQIKLRI